MTQQGRPPQKGNLEPTAQSGRMDADSARLVVMTGEGMGRKHELFDVLMLGRTKGRTSLVFDDSEVSRTHAVISRDETGQYTITDADSRNGTFVNGKQVAQAILAYGDRIRVGSQVLLFTRYSPTQSQLIERQRFEALGRLAVGIAHDFNNMLAVVNGSLEYLADCLGTDGSVEPAVAECLADGRAGTERATALARRMLEFGRSGFLGHRRVDVSKLCVDTAGLLRGSMQPSIEIECEVEPDLQVMGDVAELHQLLMNLMLNARDAMASGGVLRVTAKPGAAETANFVLIRVQDSGAGMDDVTRARIFEPFFSTKNGGGFGLGLSTVRDIVSTHAGEIEVESAPNQGTTFEVALPAAAVRSPGAAPVGEPAEDRRAAPPVQRARRSLHVLVVDDEEMARRSASRLLERAGHTVTEAEDGRQGLERYQQLEPKPDVVLLDLIMPNMAGVETYEELRALDPAVRVIVCSGRVEPATREALLAAGVGEVVYKPYSAQGLLAAVESALDCSSDDVAAIADEPTTLTQH